jgi:hypothetical protein
MHRFLMVTIVSAALTLAVGCGTTAAQLAAHRDPSKVSAHGHPAKGAVIASLSDLGNSERGSLKVFSNADRLVAHRDVRGDAHLRFVLEPGGYKIRFTVEHGCFSLRTVRVRASRTTRVKLLAPCNTY